MRLTCLLVLVIFSCNLSAMNRKDKLWQNQKFELQEKNKRFDALLSSIRDKDLSSLRVILIYYEENDQIAELNRYTKQGLTPLFSALIDRPIDGEIVEYLLSFGADPNIKVLLKEIYIRKAGQRRAKIFQGWTAAHIAIRCFADEQILHLLKKYMTDFRKIDDDGWSPIRVAKNDGNQMAQAFLRHFYPKIQIPVQANHCKQQPRKKKSSPYFPPKKKEQQIQRVIIVAASTAAHGVEMADRESEKNAAIVPAIKSDSIDVLPPLPLQDLLDGEEIVDSERLCINDDQQDEHCPFFLKAGFVTGLSICLFCSSFILQ